MAEGKREEGRGRVQVEPRNVTKVKEGSEVKRWIEEGGKNKPCEKK